MSARPDELGPSATALLGDRAYPESQVSYQGATYWLERSGDGVKRLVAVADDESVFRGFAGTTETSDGKVRFVAETTPENALALRSALPWLQPSRFGLHTSAGFGDRLGTGDAGPCTSAEGGRRGNQSCLRPAIHPRDGALPSDPAQCARRRDLGRFPGRLDEASRWRR